MLALRKGTLLVAVLMALVGAGQMWAQSGIDDVPHGPVKWIDQLDWTGQFCRYPLGRAKSVTAKTAQALGRVTIVNEQEPNDLIAEAQVLSIVPGPSTPVNIDLKGTINIGADEDLYRFNARRGDVLGLVVISESALDPVLAVEQVNGISLIVNDNHNGKATIYPPGSPMPGGLGQYDAALTWIAPSDGDFLIRVNSFASASRGAYTLQIRANRPSAENDALGTTQIIFLDFDGATLNAEQVFGEGRNPATLSPMRDFLQYWGLSLEDEALVVEAVVNVVQRNFDALRMASLNGNLPTDRIPGHYDVQVLNSRDHADPWGQPNASRVIIGGTIEQLGIPTVGVAQSIDPGNFDRAETAVVLLDQLSLPGEHPDYPDIGEYTINGVRLAGGMTIVDAIGEIVGNIATHEAGHYLGNWHTDNQNEIPCVMDKGRLPVWDMAGVGPDGILGTSDDIVVEFLIDEFHPEEFIAEGEQPTHVNTAFAGATGRVQRDPTPEVPVWPYPLTSVRASPTSGSPPLRVEFSAGGIDDDNKELTYVWDFADGSPAASGPVVAHLFETPGEFLVKVTATNSQGVKGQATVMVRVSASLPTAAIVANPLRGPAPLTVDFSAQDSESQMGDIVKYEWDLGDGTTATGPTVQHTYQNKGYYPAKVTITDSLGGTSTASALITVNAPLQTTDSAQTTPDNSQTAAPQCGLGSGVMMLSSLLGLALISRRRRY